MGGLINLLLFSVGIPIMGTVGLMMVAISVANLGRVFRAVHWRTTSGTILFSGVVPLPIPKGSEGYEPTRTQAMIRYRYHVGGQEFIGGRLCIGHGNGGRWTEEQRTLAYPAGLEVPVYYDPANPQEATLTIEADWVNLLTGLAAGLVCLAVSSGLLYITIAMFGLPATLVCVGIAVAALAFRFGELVRVLLAMNFGKPAPDTNHPAEPTGAAQVDGQG